MDRATAFILGVLTGVAVTIGLQRLMDHEDEDFGEIGETIEEHLQRLEKTAQMESISS